MASTEMVPASAIENALIGGDLLKLTTEQRVSYYNHVCKSLGLNPLTKPFAYISLNGKLVLYALKDCTEQLRNIHGISLAITAREVIEGVYVVTAGATRPDGRRDESTGAVPIEGLKGEAKANALMKAETKAKRRVTLSICGLGMLDESEIESIPSARTELEAAAGIDTGGHAVGTQAAANYVRDRLIAQGPAPFVASDEDLPTAVGGTAVPPPERPRATPLDTWKMRDAFAAVKADLHKLTGDDKEYYRILGNAGFEKSTDIKDRAVATATYKVLKSRLADLLEEVTQ